MLLPEETPFLMHSPMYRRISPTCLENTPLLQKQLWTNLLIVLSFIRCGQLVVSMRYFLLLTDRSAISSTIPTKTISK